MASQATLPELVRDFRLQASLQGSVTVHTRAPGRRGVSRHESWSRERILGNGGYGVVWLERKVKITDKNADAQATALRAVKCVKIPPSQTNFKYVRELEALAKFSQDKYCEHFVKFFGWYEVSGFLHIAMEYCEYGDLKGYLSDHVTMPENQVQDITLQVSGALSLMHSERFAHRDLKPANILIKCKPPDNWWVKVADLGLSKRAENDAASTTVRGTENFMAPEMRGFPFIGDPRLENPFAADMWSLGEIVFRALSGCATFEDPRRLLDYQQNKAGFPINILRDNTASLEAESLVVSLMSADPPERMTAADTLRHPWLALYPEPGPDVPPQPTAGTAPPLFPYLDEITEPSGQWTATVSHRGTTTIPRVSKRADNASTSQTMRPGPPSAVKGRMPTRDAARNTSHKSTETKVVAALDDTTYDVNPADMRSATPAQLREQSRTFSQTMNVVGFSENNTNKLQAREYLDDDTSIDEGLKRVSPRSFAHPSRAPEQSSIEGSQGRPARIQRLALPKAERFDVAEPYRPILRQSPFAAPSPRYTSNGEYSTVTARSHPRVELNGQLARRMPSYEMKEKPRPEKAERRTTANGTTGGKGPSNEQSGLRRKQTKSKNASGANVAELPNSIPNSRAKTASVEDADEEDNIIADALRHVASKEIPKISPSRGINGARSESDDRILHDSDSGTSINQAAVSGYSEWRRTKETKQIEANSGVAEYADDLDLAAAYFERSRGWCRTSVITGTGLRTSC
ncbi:kinase-like domain-containing protein [Cercophora newfieldiana]|uniref:non-specific serine/threonine protein kinase n=1 Tax=Cercophora newfieldiana TaxID=92897 RepID=A0AA40CNQ2_9PEZI|nr:kinase-like domain-containing protein [Cercophora newfieldiana]